MCKQKIFLELNLDSLLYWLCKQMTSVCMFCSILVTRNSGICLLLESPLLDSYEYK